jgi:sulfonate transport system substrate-binding protein
MSTRVGYFPQNNSLWVLKHRDTLPSVEWVDFRSLPRERVDPYAGLPSAHGDHLFDGGYDFIGTGSTPPVTARARDHDIVYVAISEPRHENGRLVVRADSPVRSVSDLRGKRVALGHGSWQTTLLLLALEQAGLSWQDIVPVDSYDNAAGAFLSGAVDAWVGSYPYLTDVERQVSVRTLVETPSLFTHRSLWFTRRDFAVSRFSELSRIVAALQDSDRWVTSNYAAAAAFFPGSEADPAAWEHALRTRPWGLHPVTEAFVKEQQHAADLFRANGLIDRDITVADAILDNVNDTVAATL